MINETLYQNEWVSLKRIVAPEEGVRGYVYSHETRCNGKIVALLPFRTNIVGKYPYREYLMKEEITPCWDVYAYFLSTITGGVEGDIAESAIRELREETGYTIHPKSLIDLGVSYASKSSDTIYHLFSVDLTDQEQGEILGDGSQLEASARAVWIRPDKILSSYDPQASVLFLRLDEYLCI